MNPFDEIASAISEIGDALRDAWAALVKGAGLAFLFVATIVGILGGLELVIDVLTGLARDGLNGASQAGALWLAEGLVPWWLTLGGAIGGPLGLGILWQGARHEGWI